jgi:riboflavin biosynthesis pyrimidine reductase
VTDWDARFAALCARKSREADAAALTPVTTLEDHPSELSLEAIDDPWVTRAFDGPFRYSPPPAGRPAVHVVFVESRDGNTVTDDPDSLGGGADDHHLIYEGLSRVVADAVLAGSHTVCEETFFSVWRHEVIALRQTRGLPRHPAQIVLSRGCTFDPGRYMLFNVPDVPVYILTDSGGRRRIEPRIGDRPWVHVMDADGADALARQMAVLRRAGVRHVSAVGGRTAATALVDAGLVQDVYLSHSSIAAGEPGTPWYAGRAMPRSRTILRKSWSTDAGPVTFTHTRLVDAE